VSLSIGECANTEGAHDPKGFGGEVPFGISIILMIAIFALVCPAVIVGILQPPEIGCGDDIESSVMPGASLGHGHLVGKDSAPVKNTVSVGVGEAANETRKFVLYFFAGREIAPITLRHVEVTHVIQAGHHGIFQKRRGGRESDLKTIPDLERRRLKRSIREKGNDGCSEED